MRYIMKYIMGYIMKNIIRPLMRHLKTILLIMIVVVFFVGTYGYLKENKACWDALYGSFALFAVNPIYDCTNNWISVARWLAPIFLGGELLLLIIQEALQIITDFARSVLPNTNAVYCDNDLGNFLIENIRNDKHSKHAISVKNDIVRKRVKSHIIMFSEDEKNLRFYEENQSKLENKNVFIKSEVIDSFNTRSNNIRFFNVNEIVAGKYWKDRNLIGFYDDDNNIKIKIAIIGFNQLGQKILTGGILNNIYSLNQCIEYHVWGNSTLYKNIHSDLQLMNSDTVIYHSGSWEDDINLISEMERIIVTEPDIELISSLKELALHKEIDCYDPDRKILNICSDIYTFGQYKEILTEENVKTDNLYALAKELNDKYKSLYGGVEWNELDSFTKGSNIAAAAYHSIRLLIMKKNIAESMDAETEETEPVFSIESINDEMAEMEHIRWCRYHYLNHWKYAQIKKKDIENKLHQCLIPFAELSDIDKKKDKETIEVLLGLRSDGIKIAE